MKLEEIKKFVAELRGLSQEELAKKETDEKLESFYLKFSFQNCLFRVYLSHSFAIS